MAQNRDSVAVNRAQDAMTVFRQAVVRRDGFILIIFGFLAICLISRLFTLSVVQAAELSEQGTNVRTAIVELSARRGTLYDRNGNVLAIDVPATTIYANPSKINDPIETSKILAEVLGGSAKDYLSLITANPEGTFVYVAKKTDPAFEQELRDINQEFINEEVARIQASGNDIPAEIITPLTGIEYLADTKREYPKGDIGAQIIGAVNDEGFGVSGIEQVYDEILRGVDGVRVIEQAKQISQNNDPLPMIDSVIEETDPIPGHDIILSIDIEMQQFLELNLQAVAAQRNAKQASAILLDSATGEIIATASTPLWSRDKITTEEAQNGATNAKAITQPFEPGSIFKVIAVGAALEQGLMEADDKLFCPANLEIYDKIVRDAAYREDMDMTLRQILAHSSNVGLSLIEDQLGDELYYEYLTRLSLGDWTHVDYPGETPGNLAHYSDWSPIQAANISFGQGVEVSLLQMASIYGAIANDGIMIQPHFLISRPQYDVEVEYEATQVFEPQTCRDLEDLMRTCVTEGYGMNADVPGYLAVGKTGTAEQGHLEGGYESTAGEYICSFGGYLDDSTSSYVFMSSFDNPANYADNPATTFFSSIMSFVVNSYMVENKLETPLKDERARIGVAEKTSEEEDGTVKPTGTANTNASVDASAVAPAKPESQKPAIVSSVPRPGRDWIVDTSG